MLEADLNQTLLYQPQHVSPYYMTVGQHHPLQKGRASEAEQLDMFRLVETRLTESGLQRYELSNYARRGCESQHNLLYWTDQSYWGIGLSAHSYFRTEGRWGSRFWNAAGISSYQKQISKALPREQVEFLACHQALTDFCHTRLRLMAGLPGDALQNKFGQRLFESVERRLSLLAQKDLVVRIDDSWCLSSQGRLLSNLVFAELTFLRDEVLGLEPV